MTAFPFELPTEDSLIELECRLNGQKITLALDTGASHTTIDLSFLIVAGVDPADSMGTVDLETAKGPVEAQLFQVKSLSILGITIHNFTVCAYDFLSQSVLSAIDGVVGLDFFRDRDLSISFRQFEITVV